MYWVMIAARSRTTQGHIFLFGPCNKKSAFASAEHEYRKEYNLASNIFVYTEKLHEAETEEDARDFLKKLAEEMEKNKESADA